MDDGQVTALVLLDSSSAFGTVDHAILLTLAYSVVGLQLMAQAQVKVISVRSKSNAQTFIVDGVP